MSVDSSLISRRHLLQVLCAAGLGSAVDLHAAPRTTLQKRVDEALVRALKLLAREQRPSGAWVTRGNAESAAITALAVMAFMAAGNVPSEGPYAQRMQAAIRWIIRCQKPTGLIVNQSGRGPMYSHGICSLMLAEVVGMLPEDLEVEVRQALREAIRLILAAQQVSKASKYDGGWRYQITSEDSDLSVTGWQLLALRAAKNVGCDVPAENIDRAIRYVKKCSVPGNQGFGYQNGSGPTPTRTGTGILALEVCGEHHCPEVLGGGEYLLRNPLREHDAFFYYGAYYCTVGLFKLGGDYWERSYQRLYETLLRLQNFDGSWPVGHSGEQTAGRIYSTTMSVLALAVEYRYLPIYQR